METKVLRLVLAAAAVAVLDAALGPWLLFHAPVGGIVLNAYIAAGLSLVFFWMIRDRLVRDQSRQAFEEFLVTTQLVSGQGQRWRGRLYAGLFFLIRVLSWPAFEFGLHAFRLGPLASRLRTRFTQAAAITLYPFETSLSFFLALAPAILTGVALLTARPFVYSVDFLWLMLVALLLKHMSYLIGVGTVQERLRRAQDNPLLSYVLITVCDFLALALCYNGVLQWNVAPAFDLSAITSLIPRLFAFKDFVEAVEHPPQHVVDYCIGISGLLWWLTLAQSILHIKDYKRSPLDYLSLATSYTLLGLDSRALGALSFANVTEKQHCGAKAQVYSALGDFEQATVFARRYLAQADDVPPPPKDANYIYFVLNGGITTLRANAELFCRLIAYESTHGLSDVVLLATAVLLTQIGIDPEEVARFMTGQNLVGRFPLAYFGLQWSADRESEILDEFDAAQPKEPGASRAAWLCLSPLLWPARQRSEPETHAFAQQWSTAALDEIKQIGVALDDSIEKYALIGVLSRVEDYWKRAVGSELGAIATVIAEIGASAPPDEIIRQVRGEQIAPG